MLRSKVLVPLLAVALAATVACTGGDDDSAATSSTGEAANTRSAATEAPGTSTAADASKPERPQSRSTTTTAPPRRSVIKPLILKTSCAKAQMTLARRNSKRADEQASGAEWRTSMARRNVNAAERNPKRAKSHNTAARKHRAVARMHTNAAQREGRQAKRHERRARQLNGVVACQRFLASKPLPRMPLTGEVLGNDRPLPQRPALVVKIDNHVQARPQAGLNGADIVFEEIVEYGTRFAAVYHSRSANPVGPIRSGRTQDIAMLGRLHRPLLSWSGGNANVTNAINASPLVNLSPSVAGVYYRDRSRSVDYEHTLYSNTDSLWGLTPAGWKQPGPYFRYLRPKEKTGGEPAAGVDVQMDSYSVRWAWTPERRGYLRYNSGSPHYTDGGQIIAKNVVVLEMQYRPSPADARSPEAQTIGTGRAWVYSDGRVRRGTWERKSAYAPFELTRGAGGDGAPIELKAGRTWVELAEVGVDGKPHAIPVS